jgi:hypothetical protein
MQPTLKSVDQKDYTIRISGAATGMVSTFDQMR